MNSYDYIQFLREKISEYLPSKRVVVGNKINIRCCFCGDSQKSQTKKRGWIYNAISGQTPPSYYCFNCGCSMSGINFLKAISGKDYQEIKEEYIKLYLKSDNSLSTVNNFIQPEDQPYDMFSIKPILNPDYKLPLTEKALNYLNNRKVLDAPFLKEKFYSTKDKKNNEYILIPWTLNGIEGAYYQINDFQKIHSEMKYIFPKNHKKLVYGLDNIDLSWKYIIVTEGVYDSLFIPNCISTGTKSITQFQLNIIKERYPKHQIVVSFDNDSAGISSMIKIIKSNTNFKFFKWFNSNTKQKDINDYVIYKNNVNLFIDKAKVEKMIIGALSMKMYLIENHLWNNLKK